TGAGQTVVLQPDGKLVVAGFSNDLTLGAVGVVARYNQDGSLDTSFGVNGKQTVGGFSLLESLALDSQGRVILIGESFEGSTFGIVVARLDADGSLDSSFGTGGKLTLVSDPSLGSVGDVIVDTQDRVI